MATETPSEQVVKTLANRLREYTLDYKRTVTGTIIVHAHDRREAELLARSEDVEETDDGSFELTEISEGAEVEDEPKE